jgi:hypothetical protein
MYESTSVIILHASKLDIQSVKILNGEKALEGKFSLDSRYDFLVVEVAGLPPLFKVP